MTMTSYARGLELVDTLTAAGIYATTDPQGVDGPTVLVTPPDRTYNTGCGFTATWNLYALVAPPGDGAAWQALDELVSGVEAVLVIESVEHLIYADRPAALIRTTEVLSP